jgi:replicative DNA helicase
MAEVSAQSSGKTAKGGKGGGFFRDDRPVPSCPDIERAILAAMLAEPSPCVDIAMEKLNGEDDFHVPSHKLLFRHIYKLHKEKNTVDLPLLAQSMLVSGALEAVGGVSFLADISGSIPSTANIENWCETAREYSILRGMIKACSESLEKCYGIDSSGKEITSLVDEIETQIFDVRDKHTKIEILELKEILKETFANIMKVINKEIEPGISTGFPELDRLALFKPGEMFVLAARPSIGKTSLALNMTRNVALREGGNRPVAFFSLEMTAEQIAKRLLCSEAMVSESSFYNGRFQTQELTKLTRASTTLKQAHIFIDPTGGLTIPELRAKARRLRALHKIEFIAIDYLQLMKSGGNFESRQQEVSEISSGIKTLAKELKIPILVLAQLNRELEKAPSGKGQPKLSHLRESGAIEQDADVVAFLHRDRDETKENAPGAGAKKKETEAMIIVEKNRNGSTGFVKVSFLAEYTKFITPDNQHRYAEEDRPSAPAPAT